jgi:hypothetical protein
LIATAGSRRRTGGVRTVNFFFVSFQCAIPSSPKATKTAETLDQSRTFNASEISTLKNEAA